MLDEGGWIIVLAATALALSIAEKMWRTAPAFVSLQLRLHGRDDRVRIFLQQLKGDPDHAGRVDRVRKLDVRLPVVAAIALLGWNLLLAEFLRTDPAIARVLMIMGIAASMVAAIADYVENAMLGRMIDTLPALPADPEILTANRVTMLKCWAYIVALVIIILHLPVYLYVKATTG
jgi:hypothetical protein